MENKLPTITIDNVECRLQGVPINVANIISKRLSVQVPNFWFSEKYKNGQWDGRIKFFKRPANVFPTGLIDEVVSILENEFNLSVKLVDKRLNIVDYKLIPIDQDYKISDVKVARDYQVDTVNKLITKNIHGIDFTRGIVNIATNGGKTSIAIAFIKELYPKLLEHGTNFLFVTHSKEIARQAQKSIQNDLGIEVGFIGDGKWDLKPISVAIVTTLYKRLKRPEFQHLVENVVGFVADECLSGNTQVLLPNNKVMKIKDICEREDITEVMSYNLEKNIFEPKKVLRKMITPATEQFWKVWYIDPTTGEEKGLTATRNHKIWTLNRGYVRVDELTTEDTIKINTSKPERWNKTGGKWYCPACEKEFDSVQSYAAHMNYHRSADEIRESNKRGAETRRQKYASGEIVVSESQKLASSKRMSEYNARPDVKQRSSERCKTVLSTGEMRKKQGRGVHKYILEHKDYRDALLTRFKNAPLYNKQKITALEQWVIDLGIPEIEYTGDGKLWMTFDEEYKASTGRQYKNPDFVVRNGEDKKVIEVGDIEYWHTKEEINCVVEQYKKLGYDCLYLTSRDIYQRPEWSKGKIQKFIFNHHVKISRISKYIGLIPKFKYNLEVEDNHNYIANGVLVSNCHHSSANSWYEVFNNLKNASIRIGLTGTVDKTNPVNEMKLYSCTGSIISKVSNDYLIENGYSAKPICIMFEVHSPELGDESYQDAYDLGIVESQERLDIITQICEKETSSHNTVLILVERVEHGDIIKQELEHINKNVYFTNGQLDSDTRQQLLDDLKDGKIDVLISTAILDEGVDVSNINAVIYARGGKSTRKLLQGLGRGLRKKADGSKLRFYDFIDDMHEALLMHSSARYQILKDEQFTIKLLTVSKYKTMTWKEIENV